MYNSVSQKWVTGNKILCTRRDLRPSEFGKYFICKDLKCIFMIGLSRNIQIVYKHEKLTFSIVKKMQIKTMIRNSFLIDHIREDRKKDNLQCWKRNGEMGTFIKRMVKLGSFCKLALTFWLWVCTENMFTFWTSNSFMTAT